MTKRVFIGYATGDESGANELYGALTRLQDIEPYVPERMHADEKDSVGKVVDGLDSADIVIFLITFNSTNTMWLNQEIGYACARKIPVVAIVEKGIDMKGFLEGHQHIIFQRGNFKLNIYQVLSKVREILSTMSPVTHFQIQCPACKSVYFETIPSQEETDKMAEIGHRLAFSCRNCSSSLYVDPMTLASTNEAA